MADYDGWTIEVGIELPQVVPFRRAERFALVLRHACGFTVWLDEQAYVAEVINGPVADHHRTGCTP